MTQSTFALLTTTGRAKEALALASGEPLVISAIAIGDGTTVPSGGEKKLYHEIARKTVSGHGLVAGTTNTAYFDIHLAATDGPYTIREAGLYDTAGDLIAIACYDPPINKPTPESGQTVEGDVRLQIAFSNAENVIVQVDASMQVPLQRLTVRPWVPIKSIDTKQPPENPMPGDVYVIPATATGVWKGQSQKLAEFTTAGWAITDTPNGHGVGLPDGTICIKINGIYVPWTDLLDKRYAKFPEPPASTFYVVGPTGSDKNTGLKPTPAEGFATIQGAVNALAKYMTASTITVNVSPGTYDSVNVPVSHVASWSFVGNPDNPDAVKIYAKNESGKSACFNAGPSAVVTIDGFSLFGISSCGSTNGGNFTAVNCNLNVQSGCLGFSVYGGTIFISGVINIKGPCDAVFFAADGGSLGVGYVDSFGKTPAKITFEKVSCTNAVFFARTCATLTVAAPVVTFMGVPTGTAWICSDNAVFNTWGAGTNFLPGTIAGYTRRGGQAG